METQTVFDTKPLLRPAQLADAQQEVKSAEAKLQSQNIQDKNEARRQLMRLRKTLDDQSPRQPQNADEEGRMVAREKQLLSEILVGMPSQEEMRKAPPGAVDKHIAWEKRNKPKILEWKNLRLRLNPGEREAPNLERFRPVTSTLSMDNAVIPGKMIFLPPAGAALPVAFSAEQIALLRELSPEIADRLGTLSNVARAEVREILDGGIGLSAASIAGKRGVEKREAMRRQAKKKRTMSDEHKAKMAAGRARAKLEAANG